MSGTWLAIAATLQAVIGAPATLQPQGKWVVDYAEGGCVLSRQFDDGLTLGLSTLPVGDWTDFLIVGSDLPIMQGARATVTIQPTNQPRDGVVENRTTKDGRQRIVSTTIAGAKPMLANATTITIKIGDRPPLVFAPQGIDHAMAALQTCQDDLLKSWHIDPTALATIATPAVPKTSEASWVLFSDYPADAVQAHAQGVSTIMWEIGVSGKPTNCRVLRSSGSASLDKVSCAAILTRATYRPALDREGNPVTSYVSRPIRWMLGG